MNSPHAGFCGGCGQPLLSDILTEVPPSKAAASVPPTYAQEIAGSKRALEGERKQVTVLFADLCRSLELIEDSDPELARMVLDKAVRIMMDAVHRYEGTVNRIMGDGIMALFGAPLAQEGHAVRACYAALAMLEAVQRWNESERLENGINLQIRVGINSGEVVVRALQNDLSIHYDAVGTAAHLASRMEQSATPGTILIAQETARLVAGFVELRSLGSLPIKGMRESVEVFELGKATASSTLFQVTLARGLTHFIGRRAELKTLEHALSLAASGFGQVVAIVGDPGVGKSRLCFEFLGCPRIDAWRVLKTAAASYVRATPWLPVANLLRDCFRIAPNDDEPEIAAKVSARLNALGERFKPLAAPLLACLDQPVEDTHWQALTPAQRRQQMLDAAKALLFAESGLQPPFACC
jgi:class 3 adenylate cyclase